MRTKKFGLGKKIYILLFIIFAGSVALILFPIEPKGNDSGTNIKSGKMAEYKMTLTPEEKKEYWEDLLRDEDPEVVYAHFSSLYENETYGTQHVDSHLFGELLYQAKGIDGVKVCDTNFAFGCYHGFMIPAIATEGVDSVFKLDKACIEKWGEKNPACQHGIGHGLLTFLGYDHLDQSLDICSKLAWKDPIGGCTSGVFMEFNNPTNDHVNFDVRALTSDSHYPCNSIDPKFAEACYFEQVVWWGSVFENNYEKIGSLCSEIKEQAVRRACYQGVGNEAPFVNYDIEKIHEKCVPMPGKEAQIDCFSGASWHFVIDPGRKTRIEELCRIFTGEDLKYCLERIYHRNDEEL